MRALPLLLVLLLVAGIVGCGRPREREGGGEGTASGTTDRLETDLPPDTSRSGPAFLAVYPEGPLDELRVVRATDGGLVVAGVAGFPEGTRVTISLLAKGAGGTLQPVASARARVEAGRFMSPPLASVAGPPPPGIHVLRVTVPFGPGDQDPAVLRAADDGRTLRGSGMHEQTGGRIVFETTLEVPL